MAAPIARPRSRVAPAVGVIIALGSPFVLRYVPGGAPYGITNPINDIRMLAIDWIVTLTLLVIVVFWERLPLRSIGFRALSWRDGIPMGVFAVIYLALAIPSVLFHPNAHPAGTATSAQLAAIPLFLRVAMVLTAGFCEELTFRAYAIERLALLTGNLRIAGVITAVVFTLGHASLYGFTPLLAVVAVLATALTALYLKTRNLFACASVHGLIDFFGLVIRPVLAAHGSS